MFSRIFISLYSFSFEDHWLYSSKILYKDSDCPAPKMEPKGIQEILKWGRKGLRIHSWKLIIIAMELQGATQGQDMQGQEFQKGWNAEGRKLPKHPGGGECASFPSSSIGRSPTCLWTLETRCCGWGDWKGVLREHYKKASHHSWRHLKQSSPGTAWHWHHMCLLVILSWGLRLSLAPETDQGPHKHCWSSFHPASCPGHHQSQLGSPLTFLPSALPMKS